jgi:ABC-type sulfate transport system substrate-binding protein
MATDSVEIGCCDEAQTTFPNYPKTTGTRSIPDPSKVPSFDIPPRFCAVDTNKDEACARTYIDFLYRPKDVTSMAKYCSAASWDCFLLKLSEVYPFLS